MTLARTALRLQGILTLLADPVIDRLCEGRIYDSRIGDFDPKEPVPTIILTTEEDDAPAFSKNNGGVPFDHSVNLVLEIGMWVSGETLGPDGAVVQAVGNPATDSQLEAFLDLIEERAVMALTAGETPEARLLRDAVTRRVTKLKSSRFATDDGVRLAIRLITLETSLKVYEEDPLEAPAGPYAGLPEPLRSIARAMPEGWSGRKTCDLLDGHLMDTPPPPETPFRGADITYAPHALAPDARPDPAADEAAGRTYGQNLAIPVSP